MKRSGKRRSKPRTHAETAQSHDCRVEPDRVIRALAARQHGVVARAQLLAVGVSSRAIEHRLEKDRLEPLHRGVYRVGPFPARLEREMAAVLACGPEAVLSHSTAAVRWELLSESFVRGPVEVSTRGTYRQPGPEIRIHRLRTLRPDEITLLDGLPITTPERTLLDLASSLGTRELEGALARAERHRVTDREAVASLLAEHRWLPGGPALRALLARDTSPAFIRSEAEKVLLDLIRRAHLPAPETNVVVEGYEVDFLWKDAWLVAEVDGFAYHSSRDAFEADRKRDAVLMAAGFRVLRVTWRHITREPEALVVRLQRAMTGPGDGSR